MKALFSILIVSLIISSSVSYAQAPQQDGIKNMKRISVIGSAELETDPDEIFVNFYLTEYYDKQKKKTGIAEIRKEFLDACLKAGIKKEDIKVETVGGNAFQDWYIRKQKKNPEFLANINYIIKFSSTAMIDALIPALNDEAVDNVYISRISSSKIEEIKKQVKILAVKAAREKASYLAEAAGEKIGGALYIEEIEHMYHVPMYREANMMMKDQAQAGDTSMPFQKMKVKHEIRAEFELVK